MIDLDILEFSLGVAESSGDKTTAIYCTSLRQLITRLRESEKDAARYRFMRDSGKFLETGSVFDSIVDQAMKEKGDE